MTNVIPMFAFKDQQLRGVMIEGEPWFVAADVCLCLGLGGFPSQHTYRLEKDEKQVVRISHVKNMRPLAHVNAHSVSLISEPGLYKLIQRSSKPEAREFDRWVRHEVLPQIRKNGGYMARDADVSAVVAAAPTNSGRNDLDLLKQVASAMHALQERVVELEQQQTQAAPKVAFVDSYVTSSGSFSFDAAARTLGVGVGQDLCRILRAFGAIRAQDSSNSRSLCGTISTAWAMARGTSSTATILMLPEVNTPPPNISSPMVRRMRIGTAYPIIMNPAKSSVITPRCHLIHSLPKRFFILCPPKPVENLAPAAASLSSVETRTVSPSLTLTLG